MNEHPPGQRPGSFDDILPCPFCNSLDLACDGMDWDVKDRKDYFLVRCGGCSVYGPWVAGNAGVAWKAWNTRSRAPRSWVFDQGPPEDWPIQDGKPVDAGRALPCPFCGNERLQCDGPLQGAPRWAVVCETCSSCTEGTAQTEASAYDAWNRRASIDGPKDAQA